MTKGESSFSSLSHIMPVVENERRAMQADFSPVIAAIEALSEKLDKEIRIDLPAMNPTFNAPPISVTVPDFPEVRIPPISVTVPEFPPFPAFPEVRIPPINVTITDSPPIKLDYRRLALIACVQPVIFVALQWAISVATRHITLPW